MFFVFFFFFLFERTRPAASVRSGRLASFPSLLPACSATSANAPQTRTLEVSLVWAREAMAMTTYTNVVLYVPSLWIVKIRYGSHAFWGSQYENPHFQKSKPFMRLSLPSGTLVGMTPPRHQAQPLKPNELSPITGGEGICLLYTSPSPRDGLLSRMPSSA